ncbi:hypothetical protein CLV24_11437 [Pontibacter ummariensis]|uniref:Uncharacterized protein n=1 Tax=Pontibacter ummariensis TaxID=1610492 RepID=A0A239HM60_9BACT|nr:hypothetical protein [Pontibacter ummariensis]PRY10309.1 hypothetical protein CLV24_11437 [Pontibacter ummariensis]SNS81933.1 hypothetical protein SAMN06296052_11437 [Pontibacter ummariensis]
MSDQELHKKLEHATRKMREAQKEYFRIRSQQFLQLSKQWEREVDKILQELENSKHGRQMSLL